MPALIRSCQIEILGNILRLLEELFVDFLNFKCFLDPATYVMTDHEARKLGTIDEDDSLAKHPCGFAGRRRVG